MLDDENLPKKGPAVFITNHIGSMGPIGAVCSIPLRLYPWIIADTIDPVIAAEYVYVDFVEKEVHLPMPFSLWLSKVITKIAIPLLNAVGVNSVPHDYEGQCRTLDSSLLLLLEDNLHKMYLDVTMAQHMGIPSLH